MLGRNPGSSGFAPSGRAGYGFLHPQLIGETELGASLGGTQGLLGSDQLERYGWVALDFTGARMVLG